jgi:hypothetical protein
MQTGIAGKNFEVRARGGIGLENGRNILAHGVEESDHGAVLSSRFLFLSNCGFDPRAVL